LIFPDTSVISETLCKMPGHADCCAAARLEQGLALWRHRFADRLLALTHAAAFAYGDIMSALRSDRGRAITAPDGMTGGHRAG
jgi:predicted nucleic acid-binding protein